MSRVQDGCLRLNLEIGAGQHVEAVLTDEGFILDYWLNDECVQTAAATFDEMREAEAAFFMKRARNQGGEA